MTLCARFSEGEEGSEGIVIRKPHSSTCRFVRPLFSLPKSMPDLVLLCSGHYLISPFAFGADIAIFY